MRTPRLKTSEERSISLTNVEFDLLAALCAAPQRIFTREQLLEASRAYYNEVYDRSIDVLVLRLRRKIEAEPSQPRLIVTERWTGYNLNVGIEIVY